MDNRHGKFKAHGLVRSQNIGMLISDGSILWKDARICIFIYLYLFSMTNVGLAIAVSRMVIEHRCLE